MPDENVLLSIDTMARVEKTIKIDGEHYPIMDPSDFGLKVQAQLSQVGRSIEDLLKTNVDANLRKSSKALNDFILTIMPGLPRDVFAQLKETHKLRIMRSFLDLIEKVNQESPEEEETEDQDLPPVGRTEDRVAAMVRQIGAG